MDRLTPQQLYTVAFVVGAVVVGLLIRWAKSNPFSGSMIGLFVMSMVVFLAVFTLLAAIATWLWNNDIVYLFTFARPAPNIWYMMGLMLFSMIVLGGYRYSSEISSSSRPINTSSLNRALNNVSNLSKLTKNKKTSNTNKMPYIK